MLAQNTMLHAIAKRKEYHTGTEYYAACLSKTYTEIQSHSHIETPTPTQRLTDTRSHTLTLTRTHAMKVKEFDLRMRSFLGHCGALWSSLRMERAISTCGPWHVDEFIQRPK